MIFFFDLKISLTNEHDKFLFSKFVKYSKSMKRKLNYSKFKKWPLWCKAERHVLMWRIQESRSRYKHEWEDICGDAWNTLVCNLPSETGRYYSRPRIGISDRIHPHFSQYSPCLYVSTPQNSECCKAQSILIVVSHAERRVPCAGVQGWKALLDMRNIGLGMQTAASDTCHSKFP
jgi:hypothetical protein